MKIDVKYLYSVLGWVLWCTLHSALISVTVTKYMKRKLASGFRFYRLFYNSISLVTLLPLLYYSVSIRGEPVLRWEGPLIVAQYLLLATSIFLFVAGGWNYSLSQFFGILQIRAGRATRALSSYDTFVASGIHKMIRHPWYLGGILFIWARDLSVSTILNNIVITCYFIIGTFLEERKLVGEFGEHYRQYQRNVSMFFPTKWLKDKMAHASRN